MIALALTVLIAAAPPEKAPPKVTPPASETAKVYFLAGDLARAQEWAQRGLKREPKTCVPLNRWLAEYASMVSHLDEFTPEQAKRFLEFDRQISPTVRGKLTLKAVQRYVTFPIGIARARAAGDRASALTLLDQVLYVDPTSAEAMALKKELLEGGNRGDAGP